MAADVFKITICCNHLFCFLTLVIVIELSNFLKKWKEWITFKHSYNKNSNIKKALSLLNMELRQVRIHKSRDIQKICFSDRKYFSVIVFLLPRHDWSITKENGNKTMIHWISLWSAENNFHSSSPLVHSLNHFLYIYCNLFRVKLKRYVKLLHSI